MKDFLGVAASVSRKMLKKMRLCIDPKQAAGKHFVVMLPTCANRRRSGWLRDPLFSKSSSGLGHRGIQLNQLIDTGHLENISYEIRDAGNVQRAAFLYDLSLA